MDIKGLLGKVFGTFVRTAVDSGVKAGEDYLKPHHRKGHTTGVRAAAKKARKAASVTRKISR